MSIDEEIVCRQDTNGHRRIYYDFVIQKTIKLGVSVQGKLSQEVHGSRCNIRAWCPPPYKISCKSQNECKVLHILILY